MRPQQKHKQSWLRDLARWDPDLVVNTGDNLAHPKSVPAVVQAMGDLLSVPEMIRGFGPVKEEAMEKAANERRRLHAELDRPPEQARLAEAAE